MNLFNSIVSGLVKNLKVTYGPSNLVVTPLVLVVNGYNKYINGVLKITY